MTETELKLLEIALRSFRNTLEELQSIPDYYGDDYREELYSLQEKLKKHFGYDFDIYY